MTDLVRVADKIRSKNAGPFWLTIDIFCGNRDAFERIRQGLDTAGVAALFRVGPEQLKRFELPDLNVVKFSLPRPAVQGTRTDRDMHGAAWAVLLEDIEIP